MKIAIGCDHIAVDLKNQLVDHLKAQGHTVFDCGTYNKVRTHYPIYGRAVGLCVATGKVDRGVVVCGTGVGITNSANKVKGVRCCLTTDPYCASYARAHLDANIIGFGSMVVGFGLAHDIVDAFLTTKYKGTNKTLVNLVDNKLKKLKTSDDLFTDTLAKWRRGDYTEHQPQKDVPLPQVSCTKRGG